MTKRTIEPDSGAAQSFTPPSPTTPASRATEAGTTRYAERHHDRVREDHFRKGAGGVVLSSLGIGTYLGADTDADDEAYTDAVRTALRSGINVIDTAINYRCQRSERAVGRALHGMLGNEQLSRDEILVCTKAGYVPLDESAPSTQEGYQGYLRREFFARGVMQPADVVAGGHCLAPGFIADCLQRSRTNLGVDAIDVFYLHNPEQQLGIVTTDDLYARVRAAFELLESRVASGEIGSYGISTWQGFRVPPGARGHLGMEALVALARDVAGPSHHFRFVQMPLSLGMPEAVRTPTQPVAGSDCTALEAAVALGLSVVTSAPLMQGQLTRGLPPAIHEMFPALETDAQRALEFACSVPGVATTLVGMKSAAHVVENIAVARQG
jgi:aryl-alcohol dehydrogenase-like predicted oxidoreductase